MGEVIRWWRRGLDAEVILNVDVVTTRTVPKVTGTKSSVHEGERLAIVGGAWESTLSRSPRLSSARRAVVRLAPSALHPILRLLARLGRGGRRRIVGRTSLKALISTEADRVSSEVRSQLWLDANHQRTIMSSLELHLARLHEIERKVGSLSRSIDKVSEGQMQQMSRELERMVLLDKQIDDVRVLATVSARRMAVSINDRDLLIRTEAGYVLCPSDDLPLAATLVDVGDLEMGTRRLIERVVRPGDVVIDAGANVGMHTLVAARCVGPSGRVVAFEPFPRTADYLQRNIELGGYKAWCIVHPVALSDLEGNELLYLGATSGHHSLYMDDRSQSAPNSVSVATVCLDAVVGPDERVDLLKIDVEGAELAVLAGAARTLRANPRAAIIAEFGPSHLHRVGVTTDEWLTAFADFGLDWKAIDDTTGALYSLTIEQLNDVESVNLLFGAPECPAWDRAAMA